MIDKTIPSGKWLRIVKSISKLNKNYESLPPLKSNGKLIFHPVVKLQSFNKYFAQVSTMTNEQEIPFHGPVPPPWLMIFYKKYLSLKMKSMIT